MTAADAMRAFVAEGVPFEIRDRFGPVLRLAPTASGLWFIYFLDWNGEVMEKDMAEDIETFNFTEETGVFGYRRQDGTRKTVGIPYKATVARRVP